MAFLAWFCQYKFNKNKRIRGFGGLFRPTRAEYKKDLPCYRSRLADSELNKLPRKLLRRKIPMEHLPIFTRLEGKKCLVVGGGEVALRKIEIVRQTGAHIHVVTRQAHPAIIEQADKGLLQLTVDSYQCGHMDQVDLVIAATGDRLLNRCVHDDASQRHLFVNVVDDASLCSFIFPAIIDRSPITIALSTGGNAPVLARLLRGKLESMIPAAYGKLAGLAARYRDIVKDKLPAGTARKNFWESAFEGDVAEQVFNGDEHAAEVSLNQLLDQHSQAPAQSGEVYLVGSGPGDPDLLTFRALRLMQKADVVVYDRLVSKPILNMVRRDASKIYVGKKLDYHCVPQEKINELLVELASQGKRVLRLKGGDPYIFGRGGEEAEKLVEAGIPFQVVPGVTAAAGASSYCGIPLTHRDYAHSVTFTTGHLKNNTVDLDWQSLVQPRQTLVIYMGLSGLPIISKKLVANGLSSDMPVAIIHRATQPDQVVVTGTLETICDDVERARVSSPALIIVGEVVRLHNVLGQGEQEQFKVLEPVLSAANG
jgi:uroporphyrin-III C-methyltransferase/precorrin-2 dehydrogenase/sirohydrochlorin ferrochelatase